MAGNANAARQELYDWLIEVPDIQFKICPALLGDALGNDYRYSREISRQVVLSGAVLTLENPGEARNHVAVYTAGVEGALRAYLERNEAKSRRQIRFQRSGRLPA